MFLDFLAEGLAYRRESWVNWDPVENTVLANEQVIDGHGWRSGAPVEKRKLAQWFLRITEYADDLLEALGELDRWPERVTLMQHNRIGTLGARVFFDLIGRDDRLEVFTTRHDTLFGASFCATAANHPLATELAANNPDLAAFIAECNALGTSEAAIEKAEKRGIDTGLKLRHPVDPAIELPLYIANFVLMDYGTGAIFGCPPTISAIWISPAIRPGRGRWCCRRTPTRPISRSATRLTPATASCSTQPFSTAWT